MMPLPGSLGSGEVLAWRLDEERFRESWDSGEGAFQFGGRWSGPGMRTVYAAIDPATAILEVAVHKTVPVLDIVPHVLTAFEVVDPSTIHVVMPEVIPNPNWLRPGIPSAGQQDFGQALLETHLFVLVPSAVSTHSWNLLFDAAKADGAYKLKFQERFALDTRLHPAKKR